METCKIIIEDGLSTVKKVGVGQYTVMIEDYLNKMGILFYHINKNYLIKIKNVTLRRFLYTIWLNTIFQFELLKIKGKKQILFTNTNTPFIKLTNTKYISVVHDIRPFKIPELSTSKTINFYEKQKVIDAIKRANKIVTVSETVKGEVADLFKLDRNTISVLYNSVGPHFYNIQDNLEILKKYDLHDKKYILTVSTRQKWKHMPMIIEAFRDISDKFPNYKLVLVGKAGNDDDYIDDNNIIFTGYIKDEELPVLYKHAYCYVSASEDEGFGIPLIEAQFSNIPVICTDIPIFREIMNDSAEFFKLQKNDIANVLSNVINDDNMYSSLIKKGSKNVERFNRVVVEKQLKSIFKIEGE